MLYYYDLHKKDMFDLWRVPWSGRLPLYTTSSYCKGDIDFEINT